jgi:hypothetical protein
MKSELCRHLSFLTTPVRTHNLALNLSAELDPDQNWMNYPNVRATQRDHIVTSRSLIFKKYYFSITSPYNIINKDLLSFEEKYSVRTFQDLKLGLSH